ncbi:MAG: hypothetical protein HC898_09220 [Phycisphaerales bacterium]|nr:hypothetical protein [Phycisphaerales bacterium]
MQVRSWLGEDGQVASYWLRPFWETLVTVKNAYVAVALLTLGAQLATLTPQVKDRYPIKLSVMLRLLVAPAMALLLIYLAHWFRPGTIDPFLAQVMFIASGTPTALNAMLLCLEFDNHPDYLARAVFYSTLVSPFSITLIVFLAQSGLLAPLRMGAGM